ncbi:MAG: putative glycoside hydrolase [Ardenticatenaceae bacterium]
MGIVYMPELAFANETSTDLSDDSANLEADASAAPAETSTEIFLPLAVGHTGNESPAESPSNPPKIDNTDTVDDVVQLAWFYKPPSDDDLDTLQENFDTFILTRNDEDQRDALKARGVESPFLQYIAFEVIIDPGSCTAQPWRNQAADRIGDFCYISENHPDWFLLNTDGNRMVGDLGGGMRSVMMDPGNPEWRAFWLERARENQESYGWDGVFIDNVEGSLGKRERRNQLPAAYPDDASYQAAVEGFLAYVSTEYFQPEGRPLYGNIIVLRDSDVWFRYMQYMDGAMEEGWAVDWSDGYLGAQTWEEHMQRVEQTQAQGKQTILVAQGEQRDDERQTFAYASYLLVSDGNSCFRYTNDDNYSEPWLYSNYQIELGAPLGTRYQDGDAWVRDFANGSVRVDPTSNSATITTN